MGLPPGLRTTDTGDTRASSYNMAANLTSWVVSFGAKAIWGISKTGPRHRLHISMEKQKCLRNHLRQREVRLRVTRPHLKHGVTGFLPRVSTTRCCTYI